MAKPAFWLLVQCSFHNHVEKEPQRGSLAGMWLLAASVFKSLRLNCHSFAEPRAPQEWNTYWGLISMRCLALELGYCQEAHLFTGYLSSLCCSNLSPLCIYSRRPDTELANLCLHALQGKNDSIENRRPQRMANGSS